MLLLGCEAQGALLVDVRTDFVAGAEFGRIEIELDGRGAQTVDVDRTTPAFEGVRGAEYRGLPAGPHRVRVRLVRSNGTVLVERRAAVRVRGTELLTLLLTRSCENVECTPDRTCFAGNCVADGCVRGDEPECGTPQCTSADACSAAVACAVPDCVDRACVYRPVPAACDPASFCRPTDGCVSAPLEQPDAGALDAGRPDGGDLLLDPTPPDDPCVEVPVFDVVSGVGADIADIKTVPGGFVALVRADAGWSLVVIDWSGQVLRSTRLLESSDTIANFAFSLDYSQVIVVAADAESAGADAGHVYEWPSLAPTGSRFVYAGTAAGAIPGMASHAGGYVLLIQAQATSEPLLLRLDAEGREIGRDVVRPGSSTWYSLTRTPTGLIAGMRTGRTAFARVYSPGGIPLAGVQSPPGDPSEPSFTGAADAVYMGYRSDATRTPVVLRMDAQLAPLGPAVMLSGVSVDEVRVVWDGTHVRAAWNQPGAIVSRLMAPDGSLVGSERTIPTGATSVLRVATDPIGRAFIAWPETTPPRVRAVVLAAGACRASS